MKRAKESDKVIIPPLPNGPQFWDWKVKVAEDFMAASGLGQIAYQYILEVEKTDRTGEDFSMVFPQWVSIEAKLSAAVQAVLTGPMRQEVQRLIDKHRAFQIPVMGRWKLWVIHQHFQRDASLQQVHAYNDLQKGQVSGEQRLCCVLQRLDDADIHQRHERSRRCGKDGSLPAGGEKDARNDF